MFVLHLLFLSLMTAPTQAAQPAQPASPPPTPYDCSAPEYRQFDFWVGEWDVVSNPETRPASAPPPPPGRKPARNVITREQDGCVVLETWNDGTGGTGQSFNIYDRMRKQWHQAWVDNGGGLHQYWGEFKDGKMVYVGQVPVGPASPTAGWRTLRVTFTPLGADKMRQFSETLRPDGTWTQNYDLIYTRRVPTP